MHYEGMVDEWLFDGTTPTPKHGKPGIAFTVHCFRIRVSTLSLRSCFLVKKEKREMERRERERREREMIR